MKKGLRFRSYYPALDGMRGLAILLVVIFHNFNFIYVSNFGWLGVDLFFVLSGYLITDILLNTYNTPNYLRNFYAKRVLRIIPLYYTSLIILLLILPPILLKPETFNYYTTNQIWLWTFLQNWLYILKQPTGEGIMLHYWSLAVEEQFYLLWPVAVIWLKRPSLLLIFISALLVLVLALRLYVFVTGLETISYFNLYTFSRIDGICIGCMVALIQRINFNFLSRYMAWIVIGFALLNFLFDFINRFYHFSFPFLALIGYTTFGMIFGMLVHECVRAKSQWISLIFSNPILRFFGRVSFGLYIFHWPIYLLLQPIIYAWWQNNFGRFSMLMSSLIPTLAAIVLSVLSYYYFESRFLKLKARFEPIKHA